MKAAVLSFTASLFVISGAGFGDANLPIARQTGNTFRDVVKRVKPAVVYIEVARDGETPVPGLSTRSSGSGVIIDARNGYVLTAYHVVENVSRVKIKLADGKELIGTDIRGDTQTDVAVVRIDAQGLDQAPLGDSDQLEVGDWVLAIGSPFGAALENSVSAGIVSAKGRRTNVLGKMGIENYIQTDAVINKGNSGGPLVNTQGQIIGINSNIISSTGMYAGLGFAVPSNMVKPVLDRLIKEGKVVRGWLGVVIASMSEVKGAIPTAIVQRGGAFVVEVIGDGPGERGGLRRGDIILSIDDKNVRDSFELINSVSWKRPGDIAKCQLWRGGEMLTLPVMLGERPKAGIEAKPAAADAVIPGSAVKRLGLSVADLDVQISQGAEISHVRAAIILKIEEGLLARQFNLSVGDIITRIDDQLIESAKDFERMTAHANLEKGLKLTILNSSGEHIVTIKTN